MFACQISFLENQGYKSAVLQKEPFQLKRRTLQAKSFEMVMKFNFIDSCGCPSTEIIVPLNFKVSRDCFELDKDAILQKLRHTAIQESCCGQNAVVERNALLTPKTDVIVYAIVTNVIRYKKTTEALEADSLSNGVKRRRESANGTETSRKRSKVHRRKPRF
ncbi:unnamed protein product [Prunus armeniaca]|uniref:Uncharacterized protein n=1 Tax=Prunus armeniaca TaxID=36596 RepID=A0A6J5UWD3_PRUAR|nr:unnamed protein product [Prunus armeniaca]CAB4308632.1 unnamed protein product [Prunus armeniaca]